MVPDDRSDNAVRSAEIPGQPTAIRHLEVLSEASRSFAEAGLDLQSVLDAITRQVAGLATDLCVIRLLSDDGQWLVPVASYHPDPEAQTLMQSILTVPQRADEGMQGAVVQSGQPLRISTISPEHLRSQVQPQWRDYLERIGIYSILVVPLRTRGQIIGGLGAFRSTPGQPYSHEDEILIQELADRAALAIDSTRLHEALAARERRLQDLVGRLLLAQEEERRRVAYDVHDGLAQIAASAHQHLQAFAYRHQPATSEEAEQLQRCLELSRQTIREARRIIANLRPTALDDFGLAAAIRLETEQLATDGWRIEYDEALGHDRLPAPVETALFRVTQEALTNIRKHAGTREARISLTRVDGHVRLIVRDPGKGFEPERAVPGSGAGERVGIPGIRERIALLGGECRIESEPGAGTAILIDVPLYEVQHGEQHEDE